MIFGLSGLNYSALSKGYLKSLIILFIGKKGLGIVAHSTGGGTEGTRFLQPGEEKAKARDMIASTWGMKTEPVFSRVQKRNKRQLSEVKFLRGSRKNFFTRREEKHRKRLPSEVAGDTQNLTAHSPEQPDLAPRLGAVC